MKQPPHKSTIFVLLTGKDPVFLAPADSWLQEIKQQDRAQLFWTNEVRFFGQHAARGARGLKIPLNTYDHSICKILAVVRITTDSFRNMEEKLLTFVQ